MIILDTNVLLFLAGLEDNEHINRKKLESFVHNKEVCVSPITIFEILNLKTFRDRYSFIIQNIVGLTKSVSFVGTSFYDNYFNRDDVYNLENKGLDHQKKYGL